MKSAKEANRVMTPENALVGVLATVTSNTLEPERAIVAASLVSSANDNLHATRMAIADARTTIPSTFSHSRSYGVPVFGLEPEGPTQIPHPEPRR